MPTGDGWARIIQGNSDEEVVFSERRHFCSDIGDTASGRFG
jgi:hypothetical protein